MLKNEYLVAKIGGALQLRTSLLKLERSVAVNVVTLIGGADGAPTPMFDLTFVLTFGHSLANVERLVLFCIEADLCNQILIFQHFSRSTRFAFLSTARNLEISHVFFKSLMIFSNFCLKYLFFSQKIISWGFKIFLRVREATLSGALKCMQRW